MKPLAPISIMSIDLTTKHDVCSNFDGVAERMGYLVKPLCSTGERADVSGSRGAHDKLKTKGKRREGENDERESTREGWMRAH